MGITQKNTAPDWAFICAAGMGNRMRPLTDTMPKPLVPIAGRPLLDYMVDHLLDAGITDIVLNTHYMYEQIEDWANKRAATTPSVTLTLHNEDTLLDTGGGLQNAIAKDNRTRPFYMINGDAFWINSATGTTLNQLRDDWCARDCRLLLLLEHMDKMTLTSGAGDYAPDDKQQLHRCHSQDGEYMFAGVRITRPDILDYAPKDAIYSFLKLMDAAEKDAQLFGHIHQGQWHHLSTPHDVDAVNKSLQNAAQTAVTEMAV